MRDRNTSSKYDRQDSRKNSSKSRDNHNSESYRHVLKERHYKDDERNKRKDHDRDLKHSELHSHKRRRSHSPSTKPHHESNTKKYESKSDSDRNRNKSQREKEADESYEELSRRKRKLESELRALDLAEAAAKEAENKKVCRDKHNKSTPKVPEIKVKKEPVSDDEKEQNKSSNDRRSSSGKHRSRNERTAASHARDDKHDRKHSRQKTHPVAVKVEKDKQHRSEASTSSDDSKGWGKREPEKKAPEKEKPNFETSGKLAAETNTYNGVVIKYNEPAEARKPKRRWRLYPFKGESDLPFIPIHRQSAYLFGRTRLIADIPIDHPSCSKQHAVLQFRLVPYKRENGTTGRRVRPYIIDLESSNGTYVNNNRIDPRCYVELCEKDVIKFGYSSREYVILHEESKFSDDDDDVQDGD